MTARSTAMLSLLLVAILGAAACSKPEGMYLSDVYGFAPVTPRGSGVAYLTLRNDSATAMQIDSIRSPDFALVEMHESLERNQQIFMQAVRNPRIQPGEQLELRPGGKHLMLMSPNSDIAPGKRSKIVVHFRDGSAMQASLVFHDRAKPPPGLPQ